MPGVHTAERFNPETLSLEVVGRTNSFDVVDVISDMWQGLGDPVFADIKCYDIEATVLGALKNLNRSYPACYANIYSYMSVLDRVAQAETGLLLVGETSFPPPEIKDVDKWKYRFTEQVFSMGFVGVKVDFDPTDLAREHPDRLFFRKEKDEIVGRTI